MDEKAPLIVFEKDHYILPTISKPIGFIFLFVELAGRFSKDELRFISIKRENSHNV